MSKFKDRYDDTALSVPWSVADYVRWQREQEEREEAEREAANARIITRYDPECEAAVRTLEEGWWGSRSQEGLDDSR